MSDEFKDFEEVPTLVFGGTQETPDAASGTESTGEGTGTAASETPAASAAPAAGAAAAAAQAVSEINDDILSEEEKKQVDAFSKQIDVKDSTAILQYGAGAQKKMADFSEKALANVRTKDMGEVGGMIAGLVTELKGFDVGEDEKGFLGIFKKNTNKLGVMKAKYEKAEVNVDKICQALEAHQVQLIKDIAVLDKMYELNLTYFKELTMYILVIS